MNVIILGAGGFIGTNLALSLLKDPSINLTLFDRDVFVMSNKRILENKNVRFVAGDFNDKTNFKTILEGQDVVYHLISSSVPTTSNQQIPGELSSNIVVTSKLLDACVECKISKVVFISSGGTVYGKNVVCPIKETDSTDPINIYGIQKLTIEKLLHVYNIMFNLDYRIIRLANPYGPFQRPNGILGAVTTFTYKAITNEEIVVYGDGSVVRDFIYIDDAIKGILNIANGESKYKLFNLGSGKGTSLKDLIEEIQNTLNIQMNVKYLPSRKVDVPENYLDISRYEEVYGDLKPEPLSEGILKTAQFLKDHYVKM